MLIILHLTVPETYFITFTKMYTMVWFQKEYQTMSFTLNKMFFGANAHGMPDSESQKDVKNLIQKDFTNVVNRKILNVASIHLLDF